MAEVAGMRPDDIQQAILRRRIMHIKSIDGGFARRAVTIAFVIAFASGTWARAHPCPTPTPTPGAENPPDRALDANLYMETSAEYRASCYQAYNLAADRLEWLVRHDRANSKRPKELAVVMDLDETVLNNARFYATQLRSGLSFNPALWDRWEEHSADKVELIPGAKEFILEAGELGVTVVYISNRKNKFRDKTKEALKLLGLPELKHEKDLKLAPDPDPTSGDKTTRRQEAQNDYKVLLYVGDNLRDFDEKLAFDKLGFGEVKKLTDDRLDGVIQARKDALDNDPSIWGKEWIILPNPAYGDWTRALGRGEKDYDRLIPSATPTPTPTPPK
jgi:5'-nucleotidase (lipoprotein e(P4) family)